MIYINRQPATKEDFEMLKKWIKEGKTKAKAKSTKTTEKRCISIITSD